MAGRKNGLGRGLDALFPDKKTASKENEVKFTAKVEKKTEPAVKVKNVKERTETPRQKKVPMMVKISMVEPNQNQPRKQFDEDALLELTESVKQYGILQPLLVSEKKDYYEIIAGERRWRAAKLAGLKEVPVIVKEFSEQELVEISLIENIQREDLNAVEEAMAYKRLMDEFHLKQDEIADRVGKSRTAVTNSMRLLKLSAKVQQMLIDEMITAGHARAILAVSDMEKQESLAMRVFDEKLSVRETEKLVKAVLAPPKEKKLHSYSAEDAAYENLEEKIDRLYALKDRFVSQVSALEGTKVNGHTGRDSAPQIVSVSFRDVRSEVLLHALEEKGIYVSAGSACSSNKPSVSRTLKNMEIDKELLGSTLRFSFCFDTTEEEIDYCIKELGELLPVLRRYVRR